MGIDTAKLSDLSWEYRAARALQVANGIGLFTLLSEGPMAGGQIAQRCATKPAMTEKLLIACVAMGLLERTGEKYKNTQLAQTYMVRGRPLYQGDMIAHSASVWEFWNRLDDEIRLENAPKPQPDSHHDFIMAMHNIAVVGRAQMVADSVDLAGRTQLIDVGGGPGTYSIVLCRKHPRLSATIFDLPETIAITREVIATENMESQVHTREGDWNTDSFGEGNDVVLLSNVLHGAGSKADMKLAKAYDAMVSGGMLVIQDFVLNDDKTGPLTPALFNMMVGAYSRPELFAEIENAGFVGTKVAAQAEEYGATVVTASKP